MRKTFLLVFGFLLVMQQLSAQSKTVSGKVMDEKGDPLVASIQVISSGIGTSTNQQGNFTLSVPANTQSLTISAVGYLAKEVSIAGISFVSVQLMASENNMEEVVVIGYGSGRKVSNTVGLATTVNAEIIQDRPTANAFDALQGRVAGLQVFTSNGEPSAISSVRLHGVGSLGAGSTPLYVMDGIPIAAATVISLNPNDFESITILKDASSTAIYGSRAANGVIYITTKKGSNSRPPAITFQTQYGVSNLAEDRFYDNLMNTKELTDFWVEIGRNRRSYIDDTLLKQYPYDTRWKDVYYKSNVPMHQMDLSISGGGGRTSYFISGSYLNQDGLAYHSNYKRYTMRSNINTSVTDWLRMGLNLFLSTDNRQTNPYGLNSTNRGLAVLAQPFYSPKDANGNDYEGLIPGWARYHPKYLSSKELSYDKKLQINPTGYIQLSPIRNLTLKTQAGIEGYDFRETDYRLPSFIGSLNNGRVIESFSRALTRTITNTGEYKFAVNNQHNFTALVGHEYIDYDLTSFFGDGSGLTDDRLLLLSNATDNRSVGSSRTEYAYLSYFSRLEYNFNNRYFLDGSVRQDQASRFGRDNRTAMFWSAGGLWKVGMENFMNGLPWVTDLNLRASVGTTGNSDILNYQSLPLVTSFTFDNSSGWGIGAAGNPQLSWENQFQATLGVNFTLFDRARFEVAYYNRVTRDMLMDVPYPYTSGFSEITSNVGSLKNTGVDVAINFDILKKSNSYITPYVNFNYNKNEVTELFQGKEYWIIPNTGVSWAVGQPVSYFYPVFAGIDAQTGNPQWYLPNSDPDEIINTRKDPSAVTSTFSTAALQQNTGINRYPPMNGGFGLSAGYGGFSFNADFSFSLGKYLINNDRYFLENPNQFPGFNQSKSILDYWKKPGDNTAFPRYGVQFTQFDSRLVEDASFMRMKGISLGYTFSEKLLQRTGFIKGTKFYVTGRNLLTVTKYSGPDPEVDANLSYGANPNTKQIAVGLDLTF